MRPLNFVLVVPLDIVLYYVQHLELKIWWNRYRTMPLTKKTFTLHILTSPLPNNSRDDGVYI